MSRTCSICSHPERRRIDALILETVPNRRIATQFDVSESAVRRHGSGHLPRVAVQAATDERKYDHHAKLRLLEKTLWTLLKRRFTDEDDGTVLKVHASLLKNMEFELRLGEIEEIRRELAELTEMIRDREESR